MKINTICRIYDILYSSYGELHWWPGDTTYEVIIGSILTQNTQWRNVEKVITLSKEDIFPENIARMDLLDLMEIIKPTGSYRRKAICIKEITNWFGRYNYDENLVQKESLDKIRKELLAIPGIGKETADSILLYAFRFPIFVVDAYLIRLCERFHIKTKKSYDDIQKYFMEQIPNEEIYNNYHALIVVNGKNHCKKNPLCNGCPLNSICMKTIV